MEISSKPLLDGGYRSGCFCGVGCATVARQFLLLCQRLKTRVDYVDAARRVLYMYREKLVSSAAICWGGGLIII